MQVTQVLGVNPYGNWPEGPRANWAEAWPCGLLCHGVPLRALPFRRCPKSLLYVTRCRKISDRVPSPTSGLAKLRTIIARRERGG